jgi:hypothetical protein
MRPTWLIEAGVYRVEASPLLEEIRRQGMLAEVVPHQSLKKKYAIMPGIEAIRQRDWLYSVFGNDEKVFARPTSCHKLFVGRCMTGGIE